MKGLITFAFIFFSVSTALPSNEFGSNSKNSNLKKERDPSLKILGGQKCSRGYQVALMLETNDGKKGFCGGSLVAPGWVLTAAHCADEVKSIKMNFGSPNLTTPTQTANSSQILTHPKWDKSTLKYDCALIGFNPDSVKIDGTNVTTVRLPSKSQMNKTFVGEKATVSGFGLTSDYETKPSSQLMCLDGRIIPNEYCTAPYFGAVDSPHICLEGRFGRSTCRGDSGGPLTIQENDGSPTHIGIVSFGPSWGCMWGWPPVFARTTSCEDWILQTTNITQRS